MSPDYIDHSVYPDRDEPPAVLETAEAKADYVHRICSAWDYGVHPDAETFALFARWKEVFDRYPIVTSPITLFVPGSSGSLTPRRPVFFHPRRVGSTLTALRGATRTLANG